MGALFAALGTLVTLWGASSLGLFDLGGLQVVVVVLGENILTEKQQDNLRQVPVESFKLFL